MKPVSFTAIYFSLFVFVCGATAQTPSWQWAKSALGPAIDEAHAVSIDANGNCYVAGSYCSDSLLCGTYTFYNGCTNVSVSTYDIIVAKYSSSGSLLWAKSFGGGEDDKAWGITCDAAGNCYVTGSFASDTITFGSTTFYNTGMGLTLDAFVMKIDPSGNVTWAKSFAGSDSDSGADLTIDSSGNCCVTGYFWSTSLAFDATILNNASGNMAMFITKLDPSGNVLWADAASGTSGGVVPMALTIDPAGNILISGEFGCPSLTIGTSTIAAGGYTYGFLAKYTAAGNPQWATAIEAEIGHDIGVDGAGNVYVTGWFVGPTATFDTTVLINSGNVSEFYLAKYNPSGSVVWAKSAADASFDGAHSLCVDNAGNCYVTGAFSPPSITFDSITLLNNGSGYDGDIFVVAYDNSGHATWATSVAGSGDDEGYAIEMNTTGDLYVAGYFSGPTAEFTPADTLTSPYFMQDFFVAKMGEGKTGLTSYNSENRFVSVYPNPSSGCFFIDLHGTVSTAVLEIYDANGSLVYSGPMQTSRTTINAGTLPGGIYFWRASSDDAELGTGKLIIE